jgi:hypothetical protein
MMWMVEYFKQADGTKPAGVFEGEPASKRDLDLAHQYWAEYLKSRLVGSKQEEDNG